MPNIPIVHRMFLHQPTTVFAARLNLIDPPEYPIEFLAYDGVTTGAYTDIKPGMTILLGSTPGGDDYGRQRVRDNNGTWATTISIFVGRSSNGHHDGELDLVDNAYITVWDARWIWAKIPYIFPTDPPTIFKDSNLEVGDKTTDPPPIANLGSGTAGTASVLTGIMEVFFSAAGSLSVADGATIVGWLWNVKDGTITVGSTTTEDILVEFEPGFRYVELTVTDSNGKTHTAYCPVFVDDPDVRTSSDAFDIVEHRITEKGQTLSIELLQNFPYTNYPDKTLCMIWEREPIDNEDRNHMTIIGWLDEESSDVKADNRGLLRNTSIVIGDAAWWLDQIPSFPQSLTRDSERIVSVVPDITWNYMTNPTLRKYLIYLLMWGSTALEVVDIEIPDELETYQFVMLGSDGSSLWDQVDRRAQAALPDYRLTCDRHGKIMVKPDPQVRELADRTTEIMANIFEFDWTKITFTRRRHPKYHWLRSGAVLTGTTQPIRTAFSLAPGNAPGQGGSENTQSERLAKSQLDLNKCEGHRYARDNSEFSKITIDIIQDDSSDEGTVPWRELEPARKEWITITMSADSAAQRGITWTDHRALINSITQSYSRDEKGLQRKIILDVELETRGVPAETEVRPDIPTVDPTPPPNYTPIPAIPPPDFGLLEGIDLLVGIGSNGKAYRTSNFTNASPTYDQQTMTSEEVFSWIVDPFSPGYNGVVGGSIDGFLATPTKIIRVDDLLGTIVATTKITFANTAIWRSIGASFGAYFPAGSNPWLICVSDYGDLSGHEGIWSTYSIDGGATWSTEFQISALFTDAIFPLALHTSPKIPGSGHTIAYGEGGADPTKLPIWGIWDAETSTASYTGPQVAGQILSSINLVGDTAEVQKSKYLYMIPPANAVRVVLSCRWEAEASFNGVGNPDMIFSYSLNEAATVGRTSDLAFDNPDIDPPNSDSNAQNFTVTWTYGGAGDWPVNRTSILTVPITGSGSPDGSRFIQGLHGNGSASTEDQQGSIYTIATVTEIEFDGGVIYNPPSASAVVFSTVDWGETWLEDLSMDPEMGLGGNFHFPWKLNDDEELAYFGWFDGASNRYFKLMKKEGGVETDISPTASGVSYGPKRYGFSIRALDSDRKYLLLSGTGNDADGNESSDKYGVWKSSDYGSTWTQLIAPATDTASPLGRRGYESAYSPDDPDVAYFWGTVNFLKYMSDGSTLQNKAGNLSSFGSVYLIGIAGGPTS